MKSKKKLLRESRLYIIVDKKACSSRALLSLVKKIKSGRAKIIQLRDKQSDKATLIKEAYALRKSLFNSKTVFIINDYIDIAKMLDCDGVHLGQGDLSLEISRRILGEDKIIGISCHNLNQALQAQNRGADYISIGPVFPTPLKPHIPKGIGLDLIKKIRKNIKIPFFAIGGINETNINKVISSGAKKVAVCRAICQAKDALPALKKLSKILYRN